MAAIAGAIFAPFASAADNFVIESFDGAVTVAELDAGLQYLSALTIPTSCNRLPDGKETHNYLAYGLGGQQHDLISTLYGIARANPATQTQAADLLALSMAWTEAWQKHRNDMPDGDGMVMWTKGIEPIWPSQEHSKVDYRNWAAYEQGDIVARQAKTVVAILNSPELWNVTVPDGNPNSYGVTYKDRAVKYTALLEETMDRFITRWFIDKDTGKIKPPTTNTDLWPDAWGRVKNYPHYSWNVTFMLMHAYETLARVHALLGDDPTKLALYKKIVRTHSEAFVNAAVSQVKSPNIPYYIWTYHADEILEAGVKTEDCAHGKADLNGLVRSWELGLYPETVSTGDMQRYTNTISKVAQASPGTLTSHIDHQSSHPHFNGWEYILPGYLPLARWNPDLYTACVNSLDTTGRFSPTNHVEYFSQVIEAKDWRFTHALPSGFAGRDIGSPAIVGDSSHAYGVFTLKAGGALIGGTRDEFHFMSQGLTGNGSIVARVVSVENTSTSARAGVMFRAGIAEDDINVGLYVAPNKNITLVTRCTTGNTAVTNATVTGVSEVKWLQLIRSGLTFTGYYSLDGQTWTQVGTTTAALPSVSKIGLVVTSGITTSLNTSIFDNVDIVALPTEPEPEPTAVASTEWSTNYSASYAVDGSTTTYWQGGVHDSPGKRYWLRVDLGSARCVNKVTFREVYDRVTSYRVETSVNGSDYALALDDGTTIGTSKTHTFSTRSARYVRLYILSATNSPAISDFKVYP